MAEFSGNLALQAGQGTRGRTVLAAQAFRAPFHVSKPYWDADAETLLVQVVNPTAGILAGDKLTSEISVASGAALMVTTPSASRVFKMLKHGSAESSQHFTIANGAWLEVLPEPLVPHRGSRFRQTTRIDVAKNGELFFTDLLLPGRVAHGEAWEWDQLVLKTEVRLDGELILRERFDQSGAGLRQLAELGGSGPAACFGNAILIAGESEQDSAWQLALSALHSYEFWIGVSALRRGGWSIKFVARDGMRLRKGLRAVREALAFRFPRLRCNPRKL